MQTICVHHLDAQYRLPRTQASDATIVQRRMDQIATDLLSRLWENQLTQQNASDEALYFIENLTLELTLDPSIRNDRTLAEGWAQALQAGILRTLNQRDVYVLVFRNRAEFLASFLDDLLQGRAWNYWYYQELLSLRSLTVGQAVVQGLTEDGDRGRDVLLELTQRGSLDPLVAVLSDAEVEAIVTTCLLPPSPVLVLPNVYRIWVEHLIALVKRYPLTVAATPARNLTRLYLLLLRQNPELGPDVHLARFILEILQLQQAVTNLTNRRQFLIQLEAGNLTAALRYLKGSDEKQQLTTLFHETSGTEVAALFQALQGEAFPVPMPASEPSTELASDEEQASSIETPPAISRRLSTPFGGVFLLMPAIAELELFPFFQTCPYPESTELEKARLLLFLIALQCLGSQNAAQASREPGLALLAGLPRIPTPPQLQEYATHLTSELHSACATQFQAHQAEIARRLPRLPTRPEQQGSPYPVDLEVLCLNAVPFTGDREWDLTLAAISVATLYQFASKLGAFATSSPDYLRRNFLESQADVKLSDDRLTVHFLTCPLQLVLRMAGFDNTPWTIPWFNDRQLMFEFN
jgi:hypothetical protein